MPGFVSGKKRYTEQMGGFSTTLIEHNSPPLISKTSVQLSYQHAAHADVVDSPILPGLPDDVAKHCLALVPRPNFPSMGGVSKKWRSFLRSKEFLTVRKLAGVLEEWLYVLTSDTGGKESHWEVLDCLGHKHRQLPPMLGEAKVGFGVVVLNGKLLVIAGHEVADNGGLASDEVYQYDSCLNSWSKLANMNVARYDFACAAVNGMVYAVGGYGIDGDSLSSAEVYNPDTNQWTLIESMRRPRWGCFACGFEGKLYVMGGRSNFSIGNSRFMDVYTPERHAWGSTKNGCVMVTAHAVIGKKLFCIEWKSPRKLMIFDSENGSWKVVQVPLTGSTSIGFRFGNLDGKLLLFSLEEDPQYQTLVYNPDAGEGCEWETSGIKPQGSCLSCVTIEA